jgi:hypothetical protein
VARHTAGPPAAGDARPMEAIRTIRHAVTRFSIDVGQPYDAFRRRYEEAVPPFSPDGSTPLGLFTFWRAERPRCTSYLIGNPVVAARMYDLDPAVLSAVPFHLAISVGADGATRLTFDQPSTHLASFGGPAFAATAAQVDARFAELLGVLGAPVPPELTPAG